MLTSNENAIRIPIEIIYPNFDKVKEYFRKIINDAKRFATIDLNLNTKPIEEFKSKIQKPFQFKAIAVTEARSDLLPSREAPVKMKFAGIDDKILNEQGQISGQKFGVAFQQGFQQEVQKKNWMEHFFKFQLLSQVVVQTANYLEQFTAYSRKTESSLADLSALTGIVGEDLMRFKGFAKELALTFGTSTSEQLEMFKGIISRLGIEFGSNSQAVKGFAESVNILAKASGLDAVSSMDALTTAILQMGVPLNDHNLVVKESVRMMNIMAEGAKQGASEIPQIASALTVAGVAAKGANMGFAELNAALQALAAGGKFGAEAGTALRNVVNRLQTRLKESSGEIGKIFEKMGIKATEVGQTLTTKGLGPALEMLRDGLNRLSTPLERNQALVEMFGEEGMTAAGILLDKVDLLKSWTAVLEGTNTAYEQANIVMSTSSERINRITNAIKMAISSVFAKVPAVFSVFSGVLTHTLPLMQSLLAIKQLMLFDLVKGATQFGISLLTRLFPSIVTTQVASMGLVASMKALAVSIWAALGPIAPFVLGIGALAAAGVVLYNVLHKTAKEKKEDAEASLQATQEQIKMTEARYNELKAQEKQIEAWEQLAKKKQRSSEEEKVFQELNIKMIETYGSLVTSAKSVEEAIERVRQKNQENRQEMEKLQNQIYTFKIQEIKEKTEIIKASVEVEAENVEDAVDEIGNIFTHGLKIEGSIFGFDEMFKADAIMDNMYELIEKMKSSGTKEELMKYYGEAIDLTKFIEDPKERQKVMEAFRKLYSIKNQEFARSEEELKEMFDVTLEFLRTKAKEGKIEFEGMTFDLENAEDMDKLAELIAKKIGATKEKVKEWLELEKQKTEEKKEQEKIEKGIFNTTKTNLEKQKTSLKNELLELLYKQRKGQLLSEEEKKRIEILKLQAKQTGLQLKEIEGLEKEVDALFGKEQKSKSSGQSYSEILREQLELKRKQIENETIKEKILAQNLDKEQQQIRMREIENERNRKLIEAYKEVYGVTIQIDEQSNKINFVWDKTLTSNKKLLKNSKERLDIEQQVGELFLQQGKAIEEVAKKIEWYQEYLQQIERIKLDIEIGDIDEEEGQNQIRKLYDAMLKEARERAVQLEEEISKIGTQKGESQLLESKKEELKKTKEMIKQAIDYERNLKEKQSKEILEIEKKKYEQIVEIEKKGMESYIEQTKTLFEKYNERYKERISQEYEEQRRLLEEKKAKQVITEEHYNKQMKELDERRQQEEKIMELVNNAMIDELRREQSVRELSLRKSNLMETKRMLEEKGLMETEAYRNVVAELDKVHEELENKSNFLTAYEEKFQSSVENIIMSLAEGHKEGAKQSLKEIGATLIAMVKKYAIATITNIVLGQLGLLGPVSGLSALLFVPAIKAVVTAGVNVILEPVIKALSHFASGGRVDKETVAVIGEKETEWIVRDRDIQRVIMEALHLNNVFVNKELAEISLKLSEISDTFIDKISREHLTILEKFDTVMKESSERVKSLPIKNELRISVELESLREEIRELKEEIKNFDGRVYVVADEIDRALQQIQSRRTKLRMI